MKALFLSLLAASAFWPARAQSDSCSRVCGRRPVAISHGNSLHKLGGTNALPGTWPWVVSFQFLTRKGYKHFCAGSLISPQWVISAAHCFRIKKYIKIEYWRVLIGATKQSKPGRDAQARSIKRLVDHEDFERSGHNDLTLIELDKPVVCNDFIQPACLPDEHMKISTLTHCYVCGWGVMERSSPIKYTDVLQEGKVKLVSNDKCNSRKWYNTEIKDDNVCAISETKQTDQCQGDGGSPLMCRPARSERFWVIGINSWGINCLYKHRPGVFTSTKIFRRWIQQIVKHPPRSALVPPFKPTPPPPPVVSTKIKPYLVYYRDEFGSSVTFYLLGTTPRDATVIYLTKTPSSWSELDFGRPGRTTPSPFDSRIPPPLPWGSPQTYPPHVRPTRHKEPYPGWKAPGRRGRHHHRRRKQKTITKERRQRFVKRATTTAGYWTTQPWL